MRRLLILFIWIITSIGHAQTSNDGIYLWHYCSLADWYESNGTICGKSTEWLYAGSRDKRLEKNGKSYMALQIELVSEPTSSAGKYRIMEDSESSPVLIGIREDNGKVYVNRDDYLDYLSNWTNPEWLRQGLTVFGTSDYIPYSETVDGELILYDFGMTVGDKYQTVEGYDDIFVIAKDSVDIADGKRHCRLTLSNGLVLIEGVGCVNSPGLLIDYLNPHDEYKGRYALLKGIYGDYGMTIPFYQNDTTEVVDTRRLSLQRMPVQKVADNQAECDLLGRKLSEMPSKGVVIRNGKKMVLNGGQRSR